MAKVIKRKKPQPPSAVRLAGMAGIAFLAYLLIVAIPEFPGSVAGSLILRGLAAGLSVGLLAKREEAGFATASAAIGALVAGIVMLGMPALGAPAAGVFLSVMLSAVAWPVAYYLPSAPKWAWVAPAIAAVFLAICFLWSAGLVSGPQSPAYVVQRSDLANTPGPEEYGFDGWIYLKTVNYLREGRPYYQAFQRAWTEDNRLDGKIASPMGFREPLLFQLWRLAPGSSVGQGVHTLFLLAGVIAVLLGWWTIRPLVGEGVALLGGLAVVPLYTFGALAGLWFTMSEIWAAVAVLGALALLVRKQYLWSALLLLLAVAVREIAVVFVPAWAVAWMLCDTKKQWIPGAAVAGPAAVAVVLVHWFRAPATGSAGAGVAAWLQSTGVQRLVEAIGFGGLLPGEKVFTTFAILLAIVGCALLKDSWFRWTMLTAIVVPVLFLTSFSSGPYDYYWGMLVTPSVMALMPLVFSRLFPGPALSQS